MLSAPGFESHGDVAFATAEVDSNGDLVALDINEYYGIRSIGRIVNNLSKANEEELAKVDAIAEENKVYSEDGKYANYKYVMIDNRYFECVDPGKSLYKEIGEGASIEDLQAYLLENTDWWCEAMASAAEQIFLVNPTGWPTNASAAVRRISYCFIWTEFLSVGLSVK